MGQRGPTRLSQRLILKWANKTNPVIIVVVVVVVILAVVVVLGFGETRGVDYPTAFTLECFSIITPPST